MSGTTARVRKDADTLVCSGRCTVIDISALRTGQETLDLQQFCLQGR